MSTQRMAAAWAEFDGMVIAPAATPRQRREMRGAFYAGAAALLHEIMTMLEPGDEPTDRDVANMRALDEELRTFGRSLAAGKN